VTFLGRLLESRGLNDPQIPISSQNLFEYLGYDTANDSGEPISEKRVMGIPAFMRGVRIISGTEAGLPLKVYPNKDSRETVDVPWQGQSSTTGQTWFERVETSAMHRCTWGETFWYKKRDKNQRIVDSFPVHPSRITVDVVPLGREKIEFYKLYLLDGSIPLTDWEIMHVPGPSTDGVRGISPIQAHRQSLGIAIAAERTAARMYGQGMFHAGIITSDKPIGEEDAKAVKSRWKSVHGAGTNSAGDIMVLGNGASFSPLTIPPGDAQFLESRMFSVTEISRILGLPSWMLNDQEKSTSWGSGMEQQFIAWVTLSVKPEAQRLEQRISAELCLPRQVAEFKLEGLLRGDSAARASFYGSGIEHGWLVPNDVRTLENLDPVAWGDKPYLPYNKPAQTQPGGAA
jgi:HK97 family phage portal protein